MAAGDLVIYKAVSGSLGDWLISHFTDGPFTHVEIDMGSSTCVGEHPSGLWRGPCDWNRPHISISPRSVVPAANIGTGLAWVVAMYNEAVKNGEAHEYGWFDILDEALKTIGARLVLGKNGAWDCSDFATRYLIAASAALPLGDAANQPSTVSPNDLARAFGIKDRALFDKSGRPKK